MKLVDAEVISNEPAYPGVNLLWLSSPALAQDAHPGQFLMLRTTDSIDPFLRRALSIHRIGEGAIGILYGGSGAGTDYLRLALTFGANDMGSLMLEENVVAEAGTEGGILGFGGVKVSDAERATLAEIDKTLA